MGFEPDGTCGVVVADGAYGEDVDAGQGRHYEVLWIQRRELGCEWVGDEFRDGGSAGRADVLVGRFGWWEHAGFDR